MNIKPGGFSEIGLSTANMDSWKEFLESVGGYEEVWRGESPPPVKSLWRLNKETTVKECLLGRPGAVSGFIRLFEFEGIEQVEIRRDMSPGDNGGIFDIDLRVSAMSPFVNLLKDRGWTGISEGPVDWKFGQVEVREWLVRGPDSVVLALIERLAPRLEEFAEMQGFSHAFNSTQLVADMDGAAKFYRDLGFVAFIDLHGPLPGRGGEALGLPPDKAPGTPVDLKILHPEGVMNGSIELVRIRGQAERHAGDRGLPHNLGLNLMRFPVSDLRAYAQQLERIGLLPAGTEPVATPLEPFGMTEMIALQTPEGAWLEFYQAFS